MTGVCIDLYGLVPSLYRERDAELGYPLRALLRVIQENLAALEADVARLYDDWFVETCGEEVLGQFADLLNVPFSPAPGGPAPDGEIATWFADTRRRQVANALAHRRRKGTLTVLDEVAADVTGWPARTQELRRRVSITQSVRHPEPGRGRLVDVGDGDRLDRLPTPFSVEAMLADVRRVTSHRSCGVASPSSVAVVAWRLLAVGADRGEAYCVDDDTHFTFDPLGRDVALAVYAQPRRPGAAPAADLDVAAPITRQGMHRRLEDYYGPDRSMAVYVGTALVPRDRIVVADLSDQRARVAHGRVAVDPELGRFAFATRPAVEEGVTVRYRHLQPAPLGGGLYRRAVAPPQGSVYRVASRGGEAHNTVSGALRTWRTERDRGAVGAEAVIELLDDATYTEYLAIRLRAGERLEIRAAPGRRPVLRPLDADHDRPERLWVNGLESDSGPLPPMDDSGPLPRMAFDGVTVAGHAVALRGALDEVTFRHCTLVPGSGRGDRGGPTATSLDVEAMPCSITVSDSIVGRIVVASPEAGFDPLPLSVSDSVLDGGGSGTAVEGTDHRDANVTLDLRRVTVLGAASVHRVRLVEDCLFSGRLACEHRQTGDVRFSYLPPSSRTPRRTGCQPDGVIELVDPRLPADRRGRRRAAEILRVTPVFDSVRLGEPGYARLADGTADELLRGAHDEGEMGAHHGLWLSRRLADLQIRLAEFTPAGTDCGAVFAT